MKIKHILISFFIICFSLTIYYIYDRYSFEKEFQYFNTEQNKKSHLKIGIIGDSWASGRKIDTLLASHLYERKVFGKIYSSGHPGAKSKLIYQNIYQFGNENISSQFLIKKQPNYCLVLAGVNDIQGEIGQLFYAHHLVLIIRTLIQHNIKPIVLTIPRIGIDENSKEPNVIKKSRNKLFRSLFVKKSNDLFFSYNQTLKDSLIKRELFNEVIFLKSDSLHLDYVNYPNYFKVDAIHLSDLGDSILSKAVADIVIDNYKKEVLINN
jgi:lysophospholipase L1-like esterase